MIAIESERILLRQWRSTDAEPFAILNADARVMEFFPSTRSRQESDAIIDTIEKRIDQHGFGFWAAELKASETFIGFIGLNVPGYALPFSPCVEIGWRLAYEYWGQGYAAEGACAALAFGFKKMDLAEIVSFSTVRNFRSRRVMEKIGMVHDMAGDFDHPSLPANHPLIRHVLYRKTKHT
ncbi:MAG: GNAT family N-acetyltransferase [Candidatus Acidiferrales bacterium]